MYIRCFILKMNNLFFSNYVIVIFYLIFIHMLFFYLKQRKDNTIDFKSKYWKSTQRHILKPMENAALHLKTI